MSASAFILDGMTREAYVAATPGLHPAVRIKFRPTLSIERDELYANNSGLKPREKARSIATFLAKKLQSWDLRLPDGGVASVSADNLLRLQPVLQDSVYAILWGLSAGDEDPERPATADEQAERLEERLFAEEHSLSVGSAREVLDEKKS